MTAENQHPTFGCSYGSDYPDLAGIASWDGRDIVDGFAAGVTVGHGHCSTTSTTCDDPDEEDCPIYLHEAIACIEQIAARCYTIGDSIYP